MANQVEQILEQAGESIDSIGKAVMRELWRDVYETFQDAIALFILFSIPGWIGKLILKEEYSGFDQCYQGWNAWNVNRYGCYVIIGSGFLLWIIVTGRVLGRALKTIKNIFLPESTEEVKQ